MIDMDDTTTKIHNSIKDAGENLFEGLDVNKLNKFKNSFGDITTSSKKAESSSGGTSTKRRPEKWLRKSQKKLSRKS